MTRIRPVPGIGWTAAVLAACLIAGCEISSGNGNETYDYTPAAGKGGLVVDNSSVDDLSVYIDGTFMTNVDNDKEGEADLTPGLHRVVIEERNGDRTYGGDADLLTGRLTVLVVDRDAADNLKFTVAMHFQ